MQHLKLLATSLTASCLVMATIASAEPAKTPPTPKKHPECEGSKIKSACKNEAPIRDLVMGRLVVPPAPEPTAAGQQTSAGTALQVLQSDKDVGAQAEEPK
jgi:hypothetical protein